MMAVYEDQNKGWFEEVAPVIQGATQTIPRLGRAQLFNVVKP